MKKIKIILIVLIWLLIYIGMIYSGITIITLNMEKNIDKLIDQEIRNRASELEEEILKYIK